ncbi:hypothetical protein [Serratia fonticola]|uniref:hypothetical protein n=1 Tax=Serratia fonticola TaxID=47917 RepID=UPI0027FEE8CF|nr:hypothetical protein [Serratia fonticola]MDQ7212302.1 hypothetical protein [Serratia fonticola]HBE9082331.1 hypothetical protein [Serratia fonticola]HBE9092996.1 hypothetical protein [Serratia fonticola]HBE9155166.1 hypothetical protein [Serratia fonticola]
MKHVSNQNISLMLLKAGPVVESMTQHGITIQNVIIRSGKVVVNIVKSPLCEEWIRDGKAKYCKINSSSENWSGRQGVFEINDCRIVWSETTTALRWV